MAKCSRCGVVETTLYTNGIPFVWIAITKRRRTESPGSRHRTSRRIPRKISRASKIRGSLSQRSTLWKQSAGSGLGDRKRGGRVAALCGAADVITA